MSDQYVGEIRLVGFNFAPRGWAFANGQLLSVAQNTALFSLLGTTYGGDGVSTFALPNLQGRVPVGFGTGPGLQPVAQGEVGGRQSVTLLTDQLPPHSVQIPQQTAPVSVTGPVAVPVSSVDATATSPVGNVPASTGRNGANIYGTAQTNTDTLKPFDATLSGTATLPATQSSTVGGGQPVDVRNPYLGLNFIIALEGIYPSRS